jgi:hypothetical protein
VPEIAIPARFNGPPSTANGGYTCGRLAAHVDAEEVGVSLRMPPPLERPLAVVPAAGGGVELRDGDVLVADAAPEELDLELPEAVSPEEAATASRAGLPRWSSAHPFPTCVVCGPDRVPRDGMHVFPGELRDGLFAADWTPDESLSDGNGVVRPECVWAALDCPTSAPVVTFGAGSPAVLARLAARVDRPVRVGERHAIVSWPLSVDGRKRYGAAALFDSEGRPLAASRALWIELRR